MSTAAPIHVGFMPMPDHFPYRALFLHGRPRHKKYDTFWVKHPPMNITHRAKIFSAFDALAGFGDCISSKQVEYCDRRYLSEGEREELARKLAVLRQLTYNGKAARKNRPQVTVEYFSPCTDRNNFAYGTGGIYEHVSGTCLKVDEVRGTITIDENNILIEDISDINGSLFATVEESPGHTESSYSAEKVPYND
ncbi:MAG: hypothetical protein J6D53_10365 [Blautia sp.]|nr:hypothetical protein [Blautia sp.]